MPTPGSTSMKYSAAIIREIAERPEAGGSGCVLGRVSCTTRSVHLTGLHWLDSSLYRMPTLCSPTVRLETSRSSSSDPSMSESKFPSSGDRSVPLPTPGSTSMKYSAAMIREIVTVTSASTRLKERRAKAMHKAVQPESKRFRMTKPICDHLGIGRS